MLYEVITGEVSIGRLFAGGLVPGFLMMIALMIAVDISARRKQYLPDKKEHASFSEIIKALIDGIWAFV